MAEQKTEKLSPLELAEARRAARKAGNRAEWENQRALDIEALDALEQEYGDTSVKALDVPFTPGLPTLVVARCAKPVELARYRDSVRPAPDGRKQPDHVKAGEQLATLCRVYPDDDTYAKVRDARPGIHLQLGVAALELATGREQAESKD
jgi:hypothetical protein